MPKYRIELTDGRTMEMTADSPPSEAQVLAQMGDQPAEQQGSAFERFFKPLLPSTTPSDYLEGPKYALQHPIDSVRLLGGAVKNDPVGAVPVVGNVKRGVQDAREGNYAGAAGEATAAALSLLPFAKHLPVPDLGNIGAGISKVGRGMETAGTATRKPMLGLGALEALRNPKAAVTTAAIPYAAEYAGKATQKLGGAIEGLGGKKPMGVDHHMPNASGYEAGGAFGDAAESFPPSVDPYMPNSSGYEAGAGENLPPPESGRPIGLDEDVQAMKKRWYDDAEQERQNAPNPDNPVARQLEAERQAIETSSPRVLPRNDQVWGPGSVDMQGGPAQAEFSRANLKYDPQTPTPYLREQLSTATDPGQREFLAKAIDQRRRIEAATAGVKP